MLSPNQVSNPKFTILIPVVKDAFFREALNSAFAQDYTNFEIVVLNNCATGSLHSIKTHELIRYFENPTRLPPAENWNKGIGLSRGEFVVILCDDDMLKPETLRELDAFLIAHPNVEIVRFLREEILGGDRRPVRFSCPGAMIETLGEFFYYDEKYMRGTSLSSYVFNREAALAIGGFHEFPHAWGNDRLFAVEMVARKNRIGNLNKVLLSYRISSLSITGAFGVVEKMEGDYLYFQHVERIFKGVQGDYAALCSDVNLRRLQIQQDSHFISVFLWRGFNIFARTLHLLRLFRKTRSYPTSRVRSVLIGFVNFLKHFIGKGGA